MALTTVDDMSVPARSPRSFPLPPGGAALRINLAVPFANRTGMLPVVSEVSAGGVVVDTTCPKLSTAIIARRNRGGRLEWCLPKGHLESNESAEEAAVREVREETGIISRVEKHLGVIDYWFTGHDHRIHKIVYHYLLTVVGGCLTVAGDPDEEAEDAQWVPLADLPSRLSYPNEQRLAGTAAALLLQGS